MKKELLYISTIAQEKSILKASRKLYISQPALSHCLATVEEKLGTKLFYRSTKGLRLTYAGEQYYHMAIEILTRYNEFENTITEVNELKRGRIDFGITNQLAALLLPDVLPPFADKYPNIELVPYEANSQQLEQALLDRKIDFALMYSLPPSAQRISPGLDIEILIEEAFVLIAPYGSELSQYTSTDDGYHYPVLPPKYISTKPFILVHPEQRSRQVVNNIFQRAKIQPPVRFITKNYETARRLCCRGMGLTFVPYNNSILSDSRYQSRCYQLPKQFDAYWNLTFSFAKDGYIPLASRELMEAFRTAVSHNYLKKQLYD